MLVNWLNKRFDRRPTKLELEKRLRARGYSRNEAKRAVYEVSQVDRELFKPPVNRAKTESVKADEMQLNGLPNAGSD